MTVMLFRFLEKWLVLWEQQAWQLQSGPKVSYSTNCSQYEAHTGFTRHSREYYTLALAKLEMIDRLRSTDRASQSVDLIKGNVDELISKITGTCISP